MSAKLYSTWRKRIFQFFKMASQRIIVFDHTDLPVTVGIWVDESRSMSPGRSSWPRRPMSNPVDDAIEQTSSTGLFANTESG
jgi:hypothetical protein